MPKLYQRDIQQGNIITDEMVSKLKPGMTKNQVKYVMGSPVLANAFSDDRWDYIYTFQHSHDPREQKLVTLIFKGDKLSRVS